MFVIHAKFGYIEQIDTKFKVKVNDIYLTDDCNMFVTDDENNSIVRLFPSGLGLYSVQYCSNKTIGNL